MSTKREHFNGIFTLKKRMTKEKRRANVNIMIRQKDPKNHRAFGFCIIDLPGNYADETMAENVAYELIEGIHNSSTNKVAIIEACLLTEETQRALKIPQGILPPATCWIGLAVHDSILWQQIENNKNLQIRLALSYDITKQ
jgi:hypothetical protein